MITLGIYYLCHAEFRSTAVWLAIFFSLAGDVLLMFEAGDPKFFMMGLAAFLIAHIFYILSYRQHQDKSLEKSLKGIQKIRFSFPIVLAGTGLIVSSLSFIGFIKNTGSGVRPGADRNGAQFGIPLWTYQQREFRIGFFGIHFIYVLRFCVGNQQIFQTRSRRWILDHEHLYPGPIPHYSRLGEARQ